MKSSRILNLLCLGLTFLDVFFIEILVWCKSNFRFVPMFSFECIAVVYLFSFFLWHLNQCIWNFFVSLIRSEEERSNNLNRTTVSYKKKSFQNTTLRFKYPNTHSNTLCLGCNDKTSDYCVRCSNCLRLVRSVGSFNECKNDGYKILSEFPLFVSRFLFISIFNRTCRNVRIN